MVGSSQLEQILRRKHQLVTQSDEYREMIAQDSVVLRKGALAVDQVMGAVRFIASYRQFLFLVIGVITASKLKSALFSSGSRKRPAKAEIPGRSRSSSGFFSNAIKWGLFFWQTFSMISKRLPEILAAWNKVRSGLPRQPQPSGADSQ